MLQLYYAPGACSFVPHCALEAAGAPYEPRPVNLREGEHRKPEYLALNPRAQVPVLVVDGKPLTQIVAIAGYIAAAYPQAGLLAAEPWARAKAIEALAYMNNTIHPCFTRYFRTATFVEDAAAQAALKAAAAAKYREHMQEMDVMAQAAAGPFLFGAAPSFADFYMLTLYRWGGFAGIDGAQFPALMAHVERVAAVSAVARVIEREGIKLHTFRKA
jgi:glutathione S-transferase